MLAWYRSNPPMHFDRLLQKLDRCAKLAKSRRVKFGVVSLADSVRVLIDISDGMHALLDRTARNRIREALHDVEKEADAMIESPWRLRWSHVWCCALDRIIAVHEEVQACLGMLRAAERKRLSLDDKGSQDRFWSTMLKNSPDVSTNAFSSCLQVTTSCSPLICYHIACVLSEEGRVHKRSFVEICDGARPFSIKEWVRNQQVSGNARTVVLPAHVKRITRILSHGDCLVTSSLDCTLKAFETNDDGLVLKTVMVGHEDRVNDFAITGAGEIWSCSDDGTLKCWSLDSSFALATVRVVDKAKMMAAADERNTVACAVDNPAYPVVLLNTASRSIVRRMMLSVPRVFAIACRGTQVYVSDGKHVYLLRDKKAASKQPSSANVRRLCYAERCGLVHDTTTGISIAGVAVDLIAEPNAAFRVHKIHAASATVYVLWDSGAPHSNLTRHSLDTGLTTHHQLVFAPGSFCVDVAIVGRYAYCATVLGNIYWYDLELSQTVPYGHTSNDQVLVGLGYTHAHVAASEHGILLANNKELRLWDNGTGKYKDLVLDYVAAGCAYFEDNFVVISKDTCYWYDSDLALVDAFKTDWALEKVVASGASVLVLYSHVLTSESFYEDVVPTKKLAYWSTSSFETVPTITPQSVLFSTQNEIYISEIGTVAVLDGRTFRVTSSVDFSEHADGAAVSGCVLGDKVYTLHSRSKVLVWTRGFCDMAVVDTVTVRDGVTDIKEFNRHVLGFSTAGTVYVHDAAMRLLKIIVTHVPGKISGTHYRNNEEVVVCDKQGVIKILAELFVKTT
jgi:WD40 repeat protein